MHAPDSPGLTGFLNAVTPGELSNFAVVALGKGRLALAALPAFMPVRRGGWILDARHEGVALWSKRTGRTVKVDPGFFVVCAELYARLALAPWDGLAVAEPGGPRQDMAPAWVDGLRVAHVELLRAMRQVGLAAMEKTGGTHGVRLGAYGAGELRADLTSGGVRTNGLADVLFKSRTSLEMPGIARALLFGGDVELPALPPALGGRSALMVRVDGNGVELIGETTHTLALSEVMAWVDLDLRWILAHFQGAAVAQQYRPDTGCPPWVGKGRYASGSLAGRLLGERLRPIGP